MQIDLAKVDGWILISEKRPSKEFKLARMKEDGKIEDSNAVLETPSLYICFQVGSLDSSLNMLITSETNGIIFIIHIFQLSTINGLLI